MKKLSLTVIILLVLVSCKGESEVEKGISNYVQISLKDPSSYERISVEMIDTITVAKKIKIYEEKGLSPDIFDNEPKDKFLYYTVSHKYRAKNSFGALVICNDIVSMDEDLKVVGSHSVDE